MYKLGEQFNVNMGLGISDNASIFKGQKYRITILTERLIRFEYSEEGSFVDAPSVFAVFRRFPSFKLETIDTEKVLEIKTNYFHLVYAKEKPFNKSSLRVELKNSDRTWYYGHPEARNYMGFVKTLENVSKPTYEKGLYSADGFVSIDDSDSCILTEEGVVKKRDSKGIDVYLFMYRKDFGLCLADYFKLTGKPSMLPRYAFGNWWSREEKYTSESSFKLLKKFEKHNVPISVFLMDKDWSTVDTESRKDIKNSFSFNRSRFSSPKEFIEALHKKNIKVGLKIDPSEGIDSVHPNFTKAKEFLQMDIKDKIPFNVFSSKILDIYFKWFLHPIETFGLDFWWVDSKYNYKDLTSTNYYHYLDSDRSENKRAMLISRNGLIAPHKYGVLYSGKTDVEWSTLKELPYINSSSANAGISYWSHDIGGAKDGTEDPELYIRYVQLGCFSPIFRFYTEGSIYYKRLPWLWGPATEEIARRFMTFRHELVPYIYSAAYSYYANSLPMIQPIYYKYPEMFDDPIYKYQYYFGTEFMIAPITEPNNEVMNRAIKKIYIPDGIWYHFTTGKRYPGGKTYTTFYKDEEYPMFCRGGAIIPLAKHDDINNTDSPSKLEVHIFPGRSNTYKLYEDDGYTNLYKKGYYIITSFDYNYRKSNNTLVIRPVEGKSGIIDEVRDYVIRFRNSRKPDDINVYEGANPAKFDSYVDENDFVIEVNGVSTLSQITISCKGKDIEIDAIHILNEEIGTILDDLKIKTKLKEMIASIIFGELPLRKKRIEIRKLKKYKLEKRFIDLFLKLLEYMSEI